MVFWKLQSLSTVIACPHIFLLLALSPGPFTAASNSDLLCQTNLNSANSWEHQLNNMTFVHAYAHPETERFQHNLHSRCPSYVLPTVYASRPHNMSICPWHYVMDFDYNRYPHEMAYARCSCGQCSTSGPNGPFLDCIPLYHAFQVIKRVCEGRNYRYFFTHETLPIGCVCSHRQGYMVDSSE